MFSDPHLSRGVHRKLVDLGVEIGVRSISCWKASIVTDLETARFTEPKTHRSRVTGPGGSRFGSIWSSILNSYRSRCRNPFCDGSRAVIQNRTDLEKFENNRDRSQEYPLFFLKKQSGFRRAPRTIDPKYHIFTVRVVRRAPSSRARRDPRGGLGDGGAP